MKIWTSLLVFFLFVAYLSHGQTLVMDIDTSTEDSNPKGLKAGINGVIFLAHDPVYGLELFRSDGTKEGTKIFMDHISGAKDILLWDYEVFDDHVYYVLEKEKVIEIRKGDIQTGVSTLICKIDTRLEFTSNEREKFRVQFTKINSTVFFFFTNEVDELELWGIDLNLNQAKIVHTFQVGLTGKMLLTAQDQLFFSTSTFRADTCQLWCVNKQLQVVFTGELLDRHIPEQMETLNNSIFFTSFDSGDKKTRKKILWVSDGSKNSVKPFLCPDNGQPMQGIEFLKTLKGSLYVLDFLEERRRTLWRIVNEKKPPEPILTSKKGEYGFGYGSQFSVTEKFIYYKFYVKATDSYSLRRTNGEPGNFTILTEYPKNDDPDHFAVSGNNVYYPDHDHELWKVGDNDNKPILLKKFPDSIRISSYKMSSRNGNGRLFHIMDGNRQSEHLLFSDGTAANTTIFRYAPFGDNNAQDCSLFWKNKLFMASYNPRFGYEMWVYEPEKESFYLLKDINSQNAGAQPVALTPYRGSIYSCIRDRNHTLNHDSKYVKIDLLKAPKVVEIGIETYHSGESIQLIIPDSLMIISKHFLISGEKKRKAFPDIQNLQYVTKFKNKYLLQGLEDKTGYEFWVTDEKFDRLQLLKDVEPGRIGGTNDHRFVKMSDTLGLFMGVSRDIGKVIWRTDGRPQGTFPLCRGLEEHIDLRYGGLTILGKFKDELFFNFYSKELGYELWKINGHNGSSLVKDIAPGKEGAYPHEFINFKSWFYFAANDQIHGLELWRSDGSKENTNLFKDICPIPSNRPSKINPGSNPGKFLTNSNYMFFEMTYHEAQLWRTDGSSEGTIFLANIKPKGYEKWLYGKYYKVGPLVYFPAANHLGIELWQTDGTPQNTQMAFDLNPGPADGSPNELVVLNGEVYFSGNDGVHGNELFKFTPQGNTTESCPIKVSGGGNNSWSLQVSRTSFIPSKARIELWATNGELKPVKFTFAAGKAILDLKKFEPGTYWLYIVEGTKTWIKAIVKPKG